MMLGLHGRQIGALVTVVLVVGAVSLSWELNEETRAAVERARRDAAFASRTVVLQINQAVSGSPGQDPLVAVRNDPRVQVALESATQHAPTVLYAAFADPSGSAVVHNDPGLTGTELPDHPELPELNAFLSPLGFLKEISGEGTIHELNIPLRIGATPFGTVRVGIASTLIRQEVMRVLQRGLFVGMAYMLVAVIVAYFLTRVVVGTLRDVRCGLEALRAGDFSYRVPQQNIQEFGKVAEAINELGAEFRQREMANLGQDSLRRALDLVEDGLVVLDAERVVTHVNPLAAGFLGYSAGGAMGRPLADLLPAEHPLLPLVDSLLAGDSENASVQISLPGRAEGMIIAVAHRVQDEGAALGVLIELKDLNRLRDLQAVMDHSTVLSRLGEMAAGVAHEIRNPLNAITLHLEPLLWAPNPSPQEVRDAVETARGQIARLDRAVSGFLKVARLRRLAMVTLSPARIVRDVVELLAPEATLAGLELETRLPDRVPEVSGDPEVLRQALTNAVKNAIQAVPSKDRKILVGCRDGEGLVRIFVHDSGPGMDEETRQRAFDLYMTTKENGTGVGLPYILQAVEMHGGRVELASQPGDGTTLTLVLPVALNQFTRRAPALAAKEAL